MSEPSYQPKETPAALRARARRFRQHALCFTHDKIADQLRDLADELDARADRLETLAEPQWHVH